MKTFFNLFCKLLVLSAIPLWFSACTNNSTNTEQTDALFTLPPDTTNMFEVANFLEENQVEAIINEPTKTKNGKLRKPGIIPVPQPGDDFRRVNLDNTYWRGVQIPDCDFRGASIRSADCSEGDFENSDFRVADIRWTFFDKSNLKNCDFKQAKLFHVHVTEAIIDSTDFRGANMFGMEGHRASLRNCNFSGSLMKDSEFLDADFTGSKVVKTKLFRAVLVGSKLDSVDFSYSDFTGAGLENASFVNSRLWNANMQGAHLQGANFTGADLKGVNFFGAEFENTIFTGAKNIPETIREMIVDGRISGVAFKGENKD